MRQGKLTVLIRVWPLLLKGSPSHAANHLFWGNYPTVDLKPDQRSQASVVSGNQLSTYALGYRKLTGKDAGFMGGSMNSRKEALGTCEQPLVHEIEPRTRAAVEALRSNRLDPVLEPEKCCRCDVQDLCPASMAGSGSTRP